MASPGTNPNPPGGAPFDMRKLFNASTPPPQPHSNFNPLNFINPNLVSSPFPSPSSSYPPPTGAGASAAYAYRPPTSQFNHQQDYAPQRSMSYSTPMPQPSFGNNPNSQNPNNHGARLMAMLNAPPSTLDILQPVPQIQATSSTGSDLPVPQNAKVALMNSHVMRMPSSKLPKGRHLIGDCLVYDVDVRLPGEVQPQLEVTPITKYNSDPGLVLGRQIAVNKSYICYGLKIGAIRVLNINTASRSLLKGLAQKVTDMALFAEDVHLLASVSADGRIYVWKISEGLDEEDKPQITGSTVIAIQITGVGQSVHPRVCWHCHKQEVLVVGVGKCVLKIDTTKVRRGEKFSAEEPLTCHVERLIGGVQLVGSHDGEVTDLSMCQWMNTRFVSASVDGTIKIWEDKRLQPFAVLQPHNGHPVSSAIFLAAPHRPDHITLITGGPLNQEVKIWVCASEHGWLLPGDAESWHCTQLLELKSSEAHMEDAFFNQVTPLPEAGLLLLANAKRNAIYAVHLDYGPNPISTRMDYIAEFTVTMPILSFTGTSQTLPNSEQIVQVYCVQTQAIQQYSLDLLQCLPPPMENVIYDKSESSLPLDAANVVMDRSSNKQVEIFVSSSTPRTSIQESGLSTTRYPVIDASTESLKPVEYASCISVPLSEVTNGSYISSATPPPLPLSPRLCNTLSSFRSPLSSLDRGSSISGPSSEPKTFDCSVDRRRDVIHRNLSDAASFDNDSRNDDNKLSRDDSVALSHETKYKNPTHLVTPAEILMSNSASDGTHGNEPKSDTELKIQDVVISNDARNINVEEKVVDETRYNRNEDIEPQQKHRNSVSESKEKSFFSRASDIGLNVSRECCAISRKTSIVEDARQFNGTDETAKISRQSTGEEVPESVKDVSGKVSDLSAAIPAQQPVSNGNGQKKKGESTVKSASPLPSASNSIDTSNEPCVSTNTPVESAFAPQIISMQEILNQLVTLQREMQRQMADIISVPVTKEGKRLESALERSVKKSVKVSADALWACFQEENAKQDKAAQERMQQLNNMINNCLNKELPSVIEKAVKREMTTLGQSVARTITPVIEKTISTSIAESFQKGVGDKAVHQLEKSVNSKLEVTVARQIQAQFQTSGKQALQETLKSSLEASVIPAFEMSCRSMFEKVDTTFQKGMTDLKSAAQQKFGASLTPLTIALQDATNSASSMTQTLSGEILNGQRKLLALAGATGVNSKATNPLVTQLSNGSLGGLHEQLEVPVDPAKELYRLIAKRKYEEAFTAALQRSNVNVVSWLCSQVDLPRILSMNPLPLSQGVLLSLLQQLACDVSNGTTQKLTWMRDVLSAMNPTDPMIIIHVCPILEQVYQILNHHHSLPNTSAVELSNIRLMMHVINSMLMNSK